MIPQGTIDAIQGQREAAMRDEARFFTVEADESTDAPYDTTETTHYDGPASVREDVKALRRDPAGDASLDADAAVMVPLVEEAVEDAFLDGRCEAIFRGRTREGRVTETRRRDATVAVGVAWD
ncbi:hypothetical protein [Salinibacter altiplanensis]|uniref:hypothetical protein n=1 Tax=Salinibacter altiplanensis TaxID=1803181 RepID=UPI000C9EF93C|nr:hypothetical protein [Salinibacter altiplanensis]